MGGASPGAEATRYERIGHGYARTRREDPRIAEQVRAALGDARTVVNVGAGAGSYEPRDRHVIAIEPSDVMAAQRPADRAPAVRASAGMLPLRDDSVDAAMAMVTVHHWDAEQKRGVRELRRVARGPVVILTFDATVSTRMWLFADYLPEVVALERRTMPPIGELSEWLGEGTRVETVPLARDTPDWMSAAFWAHPERVFDPVARAATSGFARMDSQVVERVLHDLRRDLDTGAWDARHGDLRTLDSYDVGLRLVINP
jgi:SAM-dependent methyltransferase